MSQENTKATIVVSKELHTLIKTKAARAGLSMQKWLFAALTQKPGEVKADAKKD
jgi:predicted DNA binding CopG/RHH family protein